jgi:hypothetical protein
LREVSATSETEAGEKGGEGREGGMNLEDSMLSEIT